MNIQRITYVLSILAVSILAFPVPPVQAQSGGGAEGLEELVTIGTRREAGRSAADSLVPVDIISGEDLENIGLSDMNEMLRTAIPSYNVDRYPIADAATLVRPATLRGLPPDNVLILVNGKRRHRSGVIAELGTGLTEGSQGADISAIPALAFSQVEVLRDGAAAQYGSDAIAGVINYELKDDPEGYTIEARIGQYYEGDGELVQIMANGGLPLGDQGFVNLTGSWMVQDPTSRSTQRTDAEALIANGVPGVPQPYAQVWGSPEYKDNWNLFFNSGYEISDTVEVYAFGNYGQRETIGGFYYRNPNNRGGVYTFDYTATENSAGTDLTEPYEAKFRAIVDTNIMAEATGQISNCRAMLATSLFPTTLPDNCWALNQEVPGGYTPVFSGKLKDASIIFGARGEISDELSYDLSGSYGRNKVSFFIGNTWNPSNGPDNGMLQRDFSLGSNVQSEINLNADFVYLLPAEGLGLASDLSIAFGAEWREETFETILGEEASWEVGDFAQQNVAGSGNRYAPFMIPSGDDAGTTIHVPLPNLSVGAHGFAGFGPQQVGEWSRSNYALYGEVEADLTEKFTAAVAVRFEDFESFGTTTNFKVAGRYRVTEVLAVRGSVNTGFRAPTPGQENVTKISTVQVDGVLQQRGQIPATNPIAGYLGAEPLQPEESTNFSIGLLWDATRDISFTVDYFNINLEKRIASTGTINIAGQDIPAGIACPVARTAMGNLATCLEELGVPGATDLSSVSFYTNDFETTTQGIDFTASYDIEWGSMGSGLLTAAWNWTMTEVDNAGSEVSRNRVVDLENHNPENRFVLSYNHQLDDLRFMIRARYYDDWVDASWSGDPTRTETGDNSQYNLDCTQGAGTHRDQCYDGAILVDVEVAYTFGEHYTFVLGANNVFDQHARADHAHLNGTIGDGSTYDVTTPWGIDGGFYYARIRADF
ncbi:MAG: TonB-dependent receptor plug domain-containing protein [Gammaproteobacteria bacterium]